MGKFEGGIAFNTMGTTFNNKHINDHLLTDILALVEIYFFRSWVLLNLGGGENTLIQ